MAERVQRRELKTAALAKNSRELRLLRFGLLEQQEIPEQVAKRLAVDIGLGLTNDSLAEIGSGRHVFEFYQGRGILRAVD